MAEYQLSYESELDTFQLYYRYNEPPKEDWRTAALRGPALPALGNALAGAMGSAVSNVATYPLSVIVARLQTQKQNRANKSDNDEKEDKEDDEEDTSIISAAKEIYQKGGIKAFYPGLTQDTAKTVADNFLFFLAYSFFRQRRIRARFGAQRARRHASVVLPVLDELTIGVLAGSLSKLFTTPLANIVTRKQTAASSKNTREIAAQIRSEKGIKGFWSGYSATLILTLNPSITFFLNEFLKYTFLSREKRSKPSPATTFLLAALSKAAASSITYPFSMAKTRAQISGNTGTSNEKTTDKQSTLLTHLTPQILRNVISIARIEGPTALYSGLPGEVFKGFFSHGFTMLAKDAVYSLIVKSYYLLLLVLRKYPTPEELLERAREQMEEYAEVAREGAKDFAEKAKNGAEDIAEKAKNGAEEILESQPGHVAVDGSSYATPGGIEASSGLPNETAELVGDYVGSDE